MTYLYTNRTLSSPIDKSEIEANFAAFTTYIDGTPDLDERDIADKANIGNDQLESKYFQYRIDLVVDACDLAAGWPASGVLAAAIFRPRSPYKDLQTINLRDAHWACTDVGAGAPSFELQWGSFDSGSWVGTQITGSSVTMSVSGFREGHFISASTNTWLPPASYEQQDTMGIALVATGADAATLNGASSTFTCTCILQQQRMSR